MCSPSKKKLKPNGSSRSPPVPKPYTYSPRSEIFSAPIPVPGPYSSSSQSHAHAHYNNNACNNVHNNCYVPNHPQSELMGIGNGTIENFLKENEEEVKKVNDEKEDDNAYFNSFPPGFRFVPTDQEILLHYLKKKMDNEPLPRNRIHELNISDYNPETIAENYPPFGDKIWYLFTPRVRKYVNGIRPNRSAGKGYWKATGKDRNIFDENKIIGKKRALVFYEGKPPKGDKTNWIMHEYRIGDPREKTSEDDMRLDDNVLCRIYKKNKSVKDSQQQQQQQQQDVVEEKNKENTNDNYNNNYLQSQTVFQYQTVEDQGIHNNPTVNNTPITTVLAGDLPPVPLTTAPTMTTSAVPPPTVNYHTGLDNSYDENLCPNPQGLELCWANLIPNNSIIDSSPSSLFFEEKRIF